MAKGKVRDKGKETLWRRTIEEQQQGGLSVRAFCRKHALHESTFCFWRRELARCEAAQRRSAAFVAVRVAGETLAGGRIEIVLSGGRRVHVAPPVDRRALADVLAVLEAEANATRSCVRRAAASASHPSW